MDHHELRPPVGIDANTPSAARICNYLLRGKDNFQVDRAAVDELLRAAPDLRHAVRENRGFLHRVVRLLTGAGVRQFVDLGVGLPTDGNTHELARRFAPDARVAYVDRDPVVLAHARALLATDDGIGVVRGDLRRPAEILADPVTSRVIDFSAPVGVLMIGVGHFVADADRDRLAGELRAALPAGSYFAVSQFAADTHDGEVVDRITAVYARTRTPVRCRAQEEVARFFDTCALVEPGVVTLDKWHPHLDDRLQVDTRWLYGGVASLP